MPAFARIALLGWFPVVLAAIASAACAQGAAPLESPLPAPRTTRAAPPPSPPPAPASACLAALAALGASFEPAPPVAAGDPACRIAEPVRLGAAGPGVALPARPVLACDAALALARWTGQHLRPAARELGRGALTRIDTGPGFACRRRNNAATGKLSEHAFGNAVDVTGFGFAAGEQLRITARQDDHTLAAAFQRKARASACLHFTTVLGPGTDAAHADHLHLDTAERRGGYRICQ